jgi:DNA-binding NarL/FixJ family response regulator
MTMQVVVHDPLVCLRRALSMPLTSAGFHPIEPPDVQAWIGSGEPGAVIVALLDEVSADWLKSFRDYAPTRPAVALLAEVTVDSYRWALRSGASTAVSRNAAPEEIVESLAAACAQRCIMPAGIAQRLALAVNGEKHPALLTAEVEWLSGMTQGATVAELAKQAGYSEREMFRRLANLYVRMGVSGRTEALLAAQRWGIL